MRPRDPERVKLRLPAECFRNDRRENIGDVGKRRDGLVGEQRLMLRLEARHQSVPGAPCAELPDRLQHIVEIIDRIVLLPDGAAGEHVADDCAAVVVAQEALRRGADRRSGCSV